MLTIGIPTYNRRDSVVRRVTDILKLELAERVDLLVIDNGSDDGTFEALKGIDLSKSARSRVRLLQNNKNIGYAANFFTLFAECQTKYLLAMSDEDDLDGDGLQELFNFIEKNNPNFVSPKALAERRLYRGRNHTDLMKFAEHESASFYLSGLCFNVHSARTYLPWLIELARTNAFVEVYPQTALAGCLVATGSGFWLESEVSHKIDNHPSYIRHHDGGEYFHVPGRFDQFRGALMFLDCLMARADVADGTRQQIISYQLTLRRGLFNRLREGLDAESRELRRDFDRGAVRYFLLCSWRPLMRRLLSKIILRR